MLDFPHFGSIDLTLALSVDGMLCRCSERTVEKDGYALSAYAKTLLPFGGWTKSCTTCTCILQTIGASSPAPPD